MDFNKAFEQVPHCMKAQLVRSHGPKDELANWNQNWLCVTNHRVAVEGYFSDCGLEISNTLQQLMLDALLSVGCYQCCRAEKDLGMQMHSSLKVHNR